MADMTTDPLEILCDLIEAGDNRFSLSALREGSGEAINFLMRIGAAEATTHSLEVTCGACDNDHSAHLEFDPATRCYWHFCPEAGRVIVNESALATIGVNRQWVIDWLVKALPITPPIRSHVLVDDRVWHLGYAHVAGTELTVVFAIQLLAQRDLDALATVLPRLPSGDLGLVLTTSAVQIRSITFPHGYRLLDLREIARADEQGLVVDRLRLASWVEGLGGSKIPKPVGPGRPSLAALIREFYENRRARRVPLTTWRAEARAIQGELSLRDRVRTPPAIRTIERRLRILRAKDTGA